VDEVNRRLASILAADVVAIRLWSGTDEPATLTRVRTLRTDLIEPVAAFLAAFASAVQALRCAISLSRSG
jgi:adenylate cyclase